MKRRKTAAEKELRQSRPKFLPAEAWKIHKLNWEKWEASRRKKKLKRSYGEDTGIRGLTYWMWRRLSASAFGLNEYVQEAPIANSELTSRLDYTASLAITPLRCLQHIHTFQDHSSQNMQLNFCHSGSLPKGALRSLCFGSQGKKWNESWSGATSPLWNQFRTSAVSSGTWIPTARTFTRK